MKCPRVIPRHTFVTCLSVLCFTVSWSTLSWADADDPGLPTARPSKLGFSQERLDRIKPAMQHYIDQALVPGTVTLIARKGKVVYFEAQGYMDAENKIPMRKDALFRIASMTKPITSVALMTLWEEGKFQLSDPVSKFLPEFADQKVSTTADASGKTGELVPVKRPATIRDMLTHTAGLANSYRGNSAYHDEVMTIRPGDTLETFIKRLAALPLNYQPGEDWQYSLATDVIGRLVEVISGVPFDQYMQEHVLDPLDLKDTHFYLPDTQGGRLTAQYTPGPDLKIQLQDPGTNDSRWIKPVAHVPRGAGGLASTARDYARFQQMMLNRGTLDGTTILAPMTVDLMMENHTGDLPLWLPGPGMGFGLGYGIVVDRGKSASPMSLRSVYWGGAYCTISWIDRDKEIVAVLMTQVRPYSHINIRQDFEVLVEQALLKP